MGDSPLAEPKRSGVTLQVIDRAQQGDRAAQEIILRAYDSYIRRLLYRLVGPSPDLEDLSQTVMMRVLTSLSRSHRESAFSTWVGAICVHVARDALRRRRVRKGTVGFDEVPAFEPASAERVDERVVAREKLEFCQSALATLSEPQRVALILQIFEGRSVDEVARLMGAAKSTTRLRLYYGRKAFAKALARMGVAELPDEEERGAK